MKPIKGNIIDLLLEHGSYKIVGNIIGQSAEFICYRLFIKGFKGSGKKWQVVAKYRYKTTEKEMWKKLYYDNGLTPSQLGPMFWGVSRETIQNRIRKSGLKLRGVGGNNHGWDQGR